MSDDKQLKLMAARASLVYQFTNMLILLLIATLVIFYCSYTFAKVLCACGVVSVLLANYYAMQYFSLQVSDQPNHKAVDEKKLLLLGAQIVAITCVSLGILSWAFIYV